MSSSKKILVTILLLILISSLVDFQSAIRNFSYLLIIVYPIFLILFKPQIIKKDKLMMSFLIYVFWSFFLVICHSFIFESFLFHFVGMLVPNMYLFFWYFFSIETKNNFKLYDYLWIMNVFYFVVGILGIIQFHFSKDLYGIVTSSEVLATKDLDFISFRVTSITGSPQVYGLAMVLISILNLDYFLKTKSKRCLFASIFFLICAIYSQNKSVGALFCFYLIASYFLFGKKYKTIKYLAALIVVLIIFNISYFLELFFRTSTFDGLVQSEKIGRITIYKDLLTNTNPMTGQGWGRFNSAVTKIFGLENLNPESFFLLIYGESGIVVLLLLMSFIYKNLKLTDKFWWPLIIIFTLQFVFVHAAISPFIFPFFFILFLRNWQERGGTVIKNKLGDKILRKGQLIDSRISN